MVEADRLYEALSAALAAHVDPAAPAGGGAQPLRGVRGVPSGAVAALIAEAVRTTPPALPAHGPALDHLFGTAFEDGLAAIGLCATCVRTAPAEALELGLRWAERTDDVATADALGWFVLGPAAGLGDRIGEVLERLGGHARDEVRRAAAAMALAFTPETAEGAAAAGLREQLGQRQIRMVEHIVVPLAGAIVVHFVRDTSPAVQKVLRRTVRAWANDDPASLRTWARGVRGGLPRLLGAEVDRVSPKEKRR